MARTGWLREIFATTNSCEICKYFSQAKKVGLKYNLLKHMRTHNNIHVYNDSVMEWKQVSCIVLYLYAERFIYISILISAVRCKEDFRSMCSHSEILKIKTKL